MESIELKKWFLKNKFKIIGYHEVGISGIYRDNYKEIIIDAFNNSRINIYVHINDITINITESHNITSTVCLQTLLDLMIKEINKIRELKKLVIESNKIL